MRIVTNLLAAGFAIGLASTQALAQARSLAALPQTAVRLSRQRFRAMTQPGFDDACVAGIRAQLECYADGEPQRVMAAFLNKRNTRESQ